MSTYHKYYASNNIVAYAPKGNFSDHLFVYETADPSGAPADLLLPELLKNWNGAKVPKRGGRRRSSDFRRRSLYFSQRFDLQDLPMAFNKLPAGEVANSWGKLTYWLEPVFTGSDPVFARYPDGLGAPIETGTISIILAGKSPASLDDFTIFAPANGAGLTLGFTSATKARIRYIDGTLLGESPINSLTLPLAVGPAFTAGALSLSVPWPKDQIESQTHPLAFVGFAFEADPLISAPGEPTPCRTWMAQLGDQIEHAGGELCVVSLDPRDAPVNPKWMDGVLNSRVEFGKAILHSSFFSTKAQRFHLQAQPGGVARLGFFFDVMEPDNKSVSSSGNVIFHPEGPFKIVNFGKSRLPARQVALSIGPRDLIAGSAATEFFDLEGFDGIEFVRGHKAFFKEDENGSPADRKLLEDKGGLVVTSSVRFTASNRTDVVVNYHSQPADAPLFKASEPDHLTRRRAPYGTVSQTGFDGSAQGLPLFPWAGYKHADTDPLAPDLRRLEATHLALWRQLSVSPVKSLGFGSPEKGVTPQGLLANVSGHKYVKLFFGNSDSSDSARPEFSIEIQVTDTEILNEFQLALAGSQLFLVFDRPSPDDLKLIHPSARIFLREFIFSVHLDPNEQLKQAVVPDHSVIFVKYFKNKSLSQLLETPSAWGCQRFLAPDKDVARIKSLFQIGGVIPPGLDRVLNDPDWQGVLVLNLPIKSMPDIIEALRPGMVESDLKAHHFGLNFLPAKKKDVDPAQPDVPRLGSAFGLIQYKKNTEPDAPTRGDFEPGSPSGGAARSYKFVVNELTVSFINSQIATFSAEVGVYFSHLFWDSGSIQTGKSRAAEGRRRKLTEPPQLLLKGNYERRIKEDQTTEDVFSFQTVTDYHFDFDSSSYLEKLTLTRAQLSVVSKERNADKELTSLIARIGIDGGLTLRERASLPLFKVKAINLSNFGFQFDFKPKQADRFKFGLKADGISADIQFDPPSGLSSVLGALPVKLKGMMVAIGDLLDLDKLHFQQIKLGGLSPTFHFGFSLELDLGFLGKLAGELRGLRIPMLLGWRGGTSPGFAFGVQFPTLDTKLDIGIQQFIRLRAEEVHLDRCADRGGTLQAYVLQLVNAQLVMLGREWPSDKTKTAIALFIPVHPSRKLSWAIGVEPGDSFLDYIGGGHRIGLSQSASTTKAVVAQFRQDLRDSKKVCDLLTLARPESDGWSVVAEFTAGVKVLLAVADDQGLYGLCVSLPVLGELDVLYRRVTDTLGIFSAEYTLPEALRTIQMGAAAVRLPAFRLEVHTDGGFLLDVGFPWNNDFHRSCQVEVAIFVGSGGFYYGRTSAAASDLLSFTGGYGYAAPNISQLQKYKALRLGFAARVGIGRSFSIGILSAEASITIFGGLEGAAAYPPDGGSLLSPTLYALKGYVGLLLDIRAEVDFVIIRARARLLAYALVGLEIRRVLGQKGGAHYYLTLPTVLFAEIGLTVEVDVEISIGCVSITIHLAFSATWRLEETLGSLSADPADGKGKFQQIAGFALAPAVAPWNLQYRYWAKPRPVNLYVTVLPCKAAPTDVDETGSGYRTCAIGQMLLPVLDADNGFADLAKFLVGWVLRPGSTAGISDNEPITLGELKQLRAAAKDDAFWSGFPAAVQTIIPLQFAPKLLNLTKSNETDPFASIPLWPGTAFSYVPPGLNAQAINGSVAAVTCDGTTMGGDEAGFAEYARCVILSLLAEMERLVVKTGEFSGSPRNTPNDPANFLPWGKIWVALMTLSKSRPKP